MQLSFSYLAILFPRHTIITFFRCELNVSKNVSMTDALETNIKANSTEWTESDLSRSPLIIRYVKCTPLNCAWSRLSNPRATNATLSMTVSCPLDYFTYRSFFFLPRIGIKVKELRVGEKARLTYRKRERERRKRKRERRRIWNEAFTSRTRYNRFCRQLSLFTQAVN